MKRLEDDNFATDQPFQWKGTDSPAIKSPTTTNLSNQRTNPATIATSPEFGMHTRQNSSMGRFVITTESRVSSHRTSKKSESSSSKAGSMPTENQNESSIPDDTKRGIHAGRHEGATLSTGFAMPVYPASLITLHNESVGYRDALRTMTITALAPLVTRRRVLNCLAPRPPRLSQNRPLKVHFIQQCSTYISASCLNKTNASSV